MKLRIATVGSVRAAIKTAAGNKNNVPSPSLESMIEGVSHPLDRRDIVRQEVEFGNRPAPTTPAPNPNVPAVPDLGEAIRKQRS